MAARDSVVYLNGEFILPASATVSVEDRGFLFADACYEVTLVVRGACIALDRHLARLQSGLDALRIGFDAWSLAPIHDELIDRNGLRAVATASVYVQVTRGVAPRTHSFPASSPPTVLARAQEVSPLAGAEGGTRAITAEDIRWGRVDLKTTGLLANVLAQQAAIDAGVDDVILHRDGVVTEGSHTNVLAVVGHTLVTAPADHRILAGVTRGIVLELARDVGIPVEERVWTLDELATADEVLMTSTIAGVRPIVSVDGRPIGEVTPGPVTTRLQVSYAEFLMSHSTG